MLGVVGDIDVDVVVMEVVFGVIIVVNLVVYCV